MPNPVKEKELLVIEDDESIRELLVEAFEELPNCRVNQARNVEEALNVLDHKPVDLITLDLLLDGADGNSLLQQLSARQATTPVVIISASVQKASALAYPYVTALISKPFDLEELLGVIQLSLSQTYPRLERTHNLVEQSRLKLQQSDEKLKASQNLLSPPGSE